MTRNAGRGRQSASPLKKTILEVFRRRKFRRPTSLRKRAISVGKRCYTGHDFSSGTSEDERMPPHQTDKQSHAQKTVIERSRKRKRRSKSKGREGTRRRERKALTVTEVVRKAEMMSKSECKTTNQLEKDGANFAIIANTRLTQHVGIIDKARKSQMIHRCGNAYVDRLKSELNTMLCERTCMTPQQRRPSQSPSLQPRKPSPSQRVERNQNDNMEQYTEPTPGNDTQEPVEPIEVDKVCHHDVLPEERGKSELAKLFGESEAKPRCNTKVAACQTQCEEKRLSLSQPDTRRSSGLGIQRREIFPSSSALMEGAISSGHITDLLDLLDDPQMWNGVGSSGCDPFDYSLGSVAHAWSLGNKPVSLSTDSPSPVKLYPRRLY